MKLSFVIPAHNEEQLIGQCLSAVLYCIARSGADAEVIVVNNASTDATRKTAERFSLVHIIDEPRKGLSQARQSGFEFSNGDIIANIDADTIMEPGWIEKVVQQFKEDKTLVGLSGPHIFYDIPKRKQVLAKLFYIFAFGNYLAHKHVLHTSSFMQGGNFAVRRSALEKIGGFDPTFTFYGEDTDIAKRLHSVGNVVFTFSLPLKASGRRLELEGYALMAWRYFVNNLSTIFFRKAVTTTRVEFPAHNRRQNKTLFEIMALATLGLVITGVVSVLKFSTSASADEHRHFKTTIEKIRLQQHRATKSIKRLYHKVTEGRSAN